MAKITLRTIAEKVGVSPSAVSRVLRNDRTCFISPKKRNLVLQVTKEYRYVPDFSARNLVLGRTSHLAFVICRFSQLEETGPFVSKIIEAAENTARNAQFILSVVTIPYDDPVELERLCSAETLYDGLIFGSSVLSEKGRQIIGRAKMPAVILEDIPSSPNGFSVVLTDKQEGTNKAISHLKDLGHTSIAFYGHNPYMLERFQAALLANDLEKDRDLFFTFPVRNIYEVEIEAFSAADYLLQEVRKFTAVFCCNDFVALGLCRRLKSEGIAPGKDLSVMGFDDVEQLLDVPEEARFLTTVHKPRGEVGKKAVELLIRMVGKRRKNVVAQMPCRLVLRKSTAQVNPTGGIRWKAEKAQVASPS